MKLNPSKCTFGVSVGRFLGFMVTQTRIEANPTQLKAILESPTPASRKGVQQLTGRLAALGRFISQFTNHLKHFFITFKGANQAGWNEECDKALITIKQYLTEPLVLASPEADETFVTPRFPVRLDWRIRTEFGVRDHILGLFTFFFFLSQS